MLWVRSGAAHGFAPIAAAALLGLAEMARSGGGPLGVVPGVAAYILAPLALLGFGWLQAPTIKGCGAMDQIEGFRQYLGVAEEDRLNALNPPDKTPELFERFLPYAIALDVENRWAKRFAAVLAAAGTAAGAGAVGSWGSGNQDWSHDPVGFANQLGGTLSQAIASASSPPGSAIGGSGGGGGGGGGGGW